MAGTIKRVTDNMKLFIPTFDAAGWGTIVERNFDIIDAALKVVVDYPEIGGVWQNSTAYAQSEIIIDPITSTIWTCLVSHTSSATGSFADERAAHPSYWKQNTTTFTQRGIYTQATPYNTNDLVSNTAGTAWYAVSANHTSIYGSEETIINDAISKGLLSTILDVRTSTAEAINAAQEAEQSAELAALYDGPRVRDVPSLLANTTLTYANTDVDDVVRDNTTGFSYTVVSSGTTFFYISTAGGLKVRPNRLGDASISAAQFGMSTTASDNTNTTALQAAIDFSLYSSAVGGRCKVTIPPGVFTITNTIHLGYGTSYKNIILEGAGPAYAGESGFVGTTLVFTQTDRPAINIQGARRTTLRGITIVGRLMDYYSQFMSTSTWPVDDTDADVWNDPALPASIDSRYAPYAGVTIDAYSGDRPTISYPDVSYPAFLGTPPQYNKAVSSVVLLDEIIVQGFIAGVCVQPSNVDSNGDFVSIRNSTIRSCKWGISVGNSQSRNMDIHTITMTKVFAAFTNNKHGRQIGKFGGVITDAAIDACVLVLDVVGAYAGPMTFINLYAEHTWRIGHIVGETTNSKPIKFINCDFALTAQSNLLQPGELHPRGMPPTILSAANISTVFESCLFRGYNGVAPLIGRFVTLNDCMFIRSQQSMDGQKAYVRYAHNALAGGLMLLPNATGAVGVRYTAYNLDISGTSSDYTTVRSYAGRGQCIPVWAQAYGAPEQPYDSVPFPGRFFRSVSKAALANTTLNDGILEFSFASRTDELFMLQGPLPGDVIVDSGTNTVFFVFSRIGLTIKAIIQNNVRIINGLRTTIEPVSTTSGVLYYIPSRYYTPTHYMRGTFTAGSATVSAVGRDDGFSGWTEAAISSGDAIARFPEVDAWGSDAAAIIANVNQTTATITLASSSQVRTQDRRRIGLLLRQPPPSELLP